MENISRFNAARLYEKRSLLIAINAVASLSIFFFGYDQGVMGGVNGNRNYAETMGFGTYNEQNKEVDVHHTLLQGGIVSIVFCRAGEFLSDQNLGRCLLSTWNSVWCLPRRLVW